jgi:lipopolysaccharide/colanic/teichoic acid biosynthesis glycosyltransferase
MAKRIFDWLASSCGLVALAPAFLFISLWIKLDSSGPVFFRQERVGLGGQLFLIHKFRTMITNSAHNDLKITIENDLRVTRAGRWLRKYKIDELPQLFDVWLGYMSLVGPRPEVPLYVAHYPIDVRELIQSVRPGITDSASIFFKDESILLGKSTDPHQTYINEILPVKLAHYVNYVKDRSFCGDVILILKTVKSLIF